MPEAFGYGTLAVLVSILLFPDFQMTVQFSIKRLRCLVFPDVQVKIEYRVGFPLFFKAAKCKTVKQFLLAFKKGSYCGQ